MRGAWIEIEPAQYEVRVQWSLPMRERGLKYAVSHSRKLLPASLPCGGVD